MEKQYTCAYCHNRFKNKNEAERHQNSLHLRRHSWSCAALSSYEAAFHPTNASTNTPTSASSAQGSLSMTGYDPSSPRDRRNESSPPSPTSPANGVSSRSITAPDTVSQTATCGYCGQIFPNNPPHWPSRLEHLTRVHKFGECNRSKKFFRADHFRQHLKHSHAGASGKWTNLLETACCRDEECPERREPVKLILSTSGTGSNSTSVGGGPLADVREGPGEDEDDDGPDEG